MRLGRVGFDASLGATADNYLPVCKNCLPDAAITRAEVEEVSDQRRVIRNEKKDTHTEKERERRERVKDKAGFSSFSRTLASSLLIFSPPVKVNRTLTTWHRLAREGKGEVRAQVRAEREEEQEEC